MSTASRAEPGQKTYKLYCYDGEDLSNPMPSFSN
jgi:hypothetical protein